MLSGQFFCVCWLFCVCVHLWAVELVVWAGHCGAILLISPVCAVLHKYSSNMIQALSVQSCSIHSFRSNMNVSIDDEVVAITFMDDLWLIGGRSPCSHHSATERGYRGHCGSGIDPSGTEGSLRKIFV